MFTGLVQKIGTIFSLERHGDVTRLAILAESWPEPFVLGESISVEGVCLSLTKFDGSHLYFDLLQETLLRTNLGEKKKGSRINLERALRVGESLGGHFVSGHVDGVGRVRDLSTVGDDVVLTVHCSTELLSGMVPKGSITCDGVSLTIVKLMPDAFTVHLIPHTLTHTSLSELKQGDAVNLETDVIGKFVKAAMAPYLLFGRAASLKPPRRVRRTRPT